MQTHPMVDTRDMIVVHTALLRELRLAPQVVERDGPHAREHITFLLDLLEHHHTGEDRLLWPLLRDRVPAQAEQLVADMSTQHHEIAKLLDAVRRETTPDRRAELLRRLHDSVAEHLDFEERAILPLAALHLGKAEWEAIGKAGATSVPKTKLPMLFGMFMYEGDPEVLRDMLSSAPPPVRAIVAHLAPRAYARYCRRVHGTPKP